MALIFTKSQPLHLALSLVGILLHLLTFWPMKATAGGFTVDLIHRDSPLSPFYNSSNTHFGRLHDAFRRSVKRINHFNSTLDPTIQTPLLAGVGEYLMNVSIGTPPVDMLGIADTGSDLIWTQCEPCKQCYSQTLPLFDPHCSSTFQNITCQSSFCKALEVSICSLNTCEYACAYGDGSYTTGDLASETFTFGINQKVSLPNIVFGCGHYNGGIFEEAGSGIIGLGGGKLSLISQLGQSVVKKFSYCLAPSSYPSITNVSSKISFGSDAVTFGSGAVATPLMASKYGDTFYMVSLEGFSVGNKRIAYKGLSKTGFDTDEGNTIIDSGTTLTFLQPEFYEDVLKALDETVSAHWVADPSGILSRCYESGSHNINLPNITAHFKGADVKLQPMNTFQKVAPDLVCFTMIGSSGNLSIYGNLAQMNFLVGYDLDARTVSFLPTDCTIQ